MKKVYLVHCWDGSSDDGWYPWLDSELKRYDIEVVRFDMPNTASPKIDEWVKTLDSKVNSLDGGTYFIGHSIGCQAIMRYLETLEVTNIGGILFVAPWLDLLPYAIDDEESYETAYPWISTPINFEKIRKFTTNINCIFSSDDYFVSLEQESKFKQLLNANTVVVKEKGHISAEDGVYESSEILELARKMLGIWNMTDEEYIDIAIEISKHAKYPYGAIVVKDNQIVGRSDDKSCVSKTMYAHPELVAIDSACRNSNLYGELKGAIMYVSCQSCMMCMGAILYEEFAKIVYAATLQDSNNYYCPEIIVSTNDLAKYSKEEIEIIDCLHRDKAIDVLKSRALED